MSGDEMSATKCPATKCPATKCPGILSIHYPNNGLSHLMSNMKFIPQSICMLFPSDYYVIEIITLLCYSIFIGIYLTDL